jgi:hypothetical protein
MMDISQNEEQFTILSVGLAAAAVAYPGALFLFFESARVFHVASHFSDRSIGLMAAACSLSLV